MAQPQTRAFGIDTSILLRLLTGLPKKDYEATTKALEALHARSPVTQLFASNQVIGEAYVAVQVHYKVGKADARRALLDLLESGVIEPLNGTAVLEILRESKGAGLVDRLIAQDYEKEDVPVLTNDRRMAKLTNAELLR